MSRLFRLILFTLIGLILFVYLYYAEYDVLPNVGAELDLYIFTIVTSLLTGAGITFINMRLNEKLPWRKNILIRFVTGITVDFAWLAGLLIFLTWLANQVGVLDFALFQTSFEESQLEIKVIVLAFLCLFIVALVELNTYSYSEYSVGQIRKLRAERKQLEFQFEALKSQLSPHYLFNSMNTISSLIYRDAQVAETFIRNLADTFNYVLNTKNVRSVKLKEEVEALKDYAYLLRIRYGSAVDLTIDLDDALLKQPIPPLTLQLLVENAVKHNIISDDSPLKINVRNDETHLIILNNKTGTPSKTSSHKVGLNNIKKRYAFFTAENIRVVDENYFEVRLPILKDA
jgi:hypothetical protein